MGNVTKIIHKKGGVKSVIDLNKTTNITQNIITNSPYQIGEYKESTLPLSDNETLSLMDGTILSNNSYELLFNHIRELLKTNPELFTDINTYNLEVEETGECHKFVYQSYQENDQNYTLKLPTYDNSEIFHYICTRLKNTNTDKNLVKAEVNESYQIDPELADTFYITLTQADCHISIKQPTKPDFKYDLDVYFYQKVGNAKVTFDQNIRGIGNDTIEITHARDYVTYIKLTSITQGNVWMYRKIDTWYGATLSDVKAPQYKVTLALSFIGSTDWGYRNDHRGGVWGHNDSYGASLWSIPNSISFIDAFTQERMSLKAYYGNQFILGSRNLWTDNNRDYFDVGLGSLSSQQSFDQYEMLETDIKGYVSSYELSTGTFGRDKNKILVKTLSKNYETDVVPGDGEHLIAPSLNSNYNFSKPSTIYYTLYTNKPLQNISFRAGSYGSRCYRKDYNGVNYIISYTHVGYKKVKADLYYDDQLVKSQIFDIPNNGGTTTCNLDCNDLVLDWQAELDAIEAENARKLAIEKTKSFQGIFNTDSGSRVEIFRNVINSNESDPLTESDTSTESNDYQFTKIYDIGPNSSTDVVLKYDDVVRVYNISEREDVKFSFTKAIFNNSLGTFTSGNVLTYKTDDYYEMSVFRISNNFTITSQRCQGAGSLETDNTTFIKIRRNNLINKFISFNELTYFDDIEIGDVITPSPGAVLTFEKCNLVETGVGTNDYIVSELLSNYKISAKNGTLVQASGTVSTKDAGNIKIIHQGNTILEKSQNTSQTVTLSVGDFIECNDSTLSFNNINLLDYSSGRKVVTAVFADYLLISQDIVSNVSDTSKDLMTENLRNTLTNIENQVEKLQDQETISRILREVNSNSYNTSIENCISQLQDLQNSFDQIYTDGDLLQIGEDDLQLLQTAKNELSDEVQRLVNNKSYINKYNIALERLSNDISLLNEIQDKNLETIYKGIVEQYNTIIEKLPEMKSTDNLTDVITDVSDLITNLNSNISKYEQLHSNEFTSAINQLESDLQLLLNNLENTNTNYSVVNTSSIAINIENIRNNVIGLRIDKDQLTTEEEELNDSYTSLALKLTRLRDMITETSDNIKSVTEQFYQNVSSIDEGSEKASSLRTLISVYIDNILDICTENDNVKVLVQSVGTYDSQYTDEISTETGVIVLDLI